MVSKVMVFIFGVIFLSTVALAQRGGGNGNTQAPTSPVTGSSVNGKALYYAYSCYGCHGYNGETGRAFVGNWSSNLASEENFIRFLRARANVAPMPPSTSMPISCGSRSLGPGPESSADRSPRCPRRPRVGAARPVTGAPRRRAAARARPNA